MYFVFRVYSVCIRILLLVYVKVSRVWSQNCGWILAKVPKVLIVRADTQFEPDMSAGSLFQSMQINESLIATSCDVPTVFPEEIVPKMCEKSSSRTFPKSVHNWPQDMCFPSYAAAKQAGILREVWEAVAVG